MTPDFMRQLMPQFLQGMYQGRSFPVTMPFGETDPLGWAFYGDGEAAATVTTLKVDDQLEGLLRINSGLVTNVPLERAPCLHETMSEVNSNLYFGRAWATLRGDESCMLALMQEILPLAFIAETAGPSTRFLGSMIEAMSQAAARATNDALTRCGGDRLDNALIILMSG